MPKLIRFIKVCDVGKIGEVKNYANASADSLVEQGYAEYVEKSDQHREFETKKEIEDHFLEQGLKVCPYCNMRIPVKEWNDHLIYEKNIPGLKVCETSKNDGEFVSHWNYVINNLDKKRAQKPEKEENGKKEKVTQKGKNTDSDDCLTVEVVELTRGVKQSDDPNCLNLNKLNKLNNIYNLNNLNTTSILGTPTTKVEKLFFYLYDNKEQTPEEIEKAIGVPLRTLYTYKTREKGNIISKRGSSGATYDISHELREKIELRIKQKIEQKKREKDELSNTQDKLEEQINMFERMGELINLDLDSKNNKNPLIKIDGKFAWVDLVELKELDYKVFDYLIDEPVRFAKNINELLEERGFSLKTRFKNYTECLSPKTIDSIRAKDIDKLHLLEVRTAILSDVRPTIKSAKFECPSCSSIINIFQNTKKFKEPTKCSCGRRGGFRVLSKDLHDAVRVELEDLSDLTDSPQIKSLNAYAESHLTSSKELYKLNPGSEVKVLGVLREVDIASATGGKLNKMDYLFEILEVEPFEAEIDVSSFTEKEIAEYQNISSTVKKTNNLSELRDSFAPDIIKNEIVKDVLLLKSAQGRGRKNKSNILLIGNPGTSKSVLVKKYHALMPGSNYVSGAGSSAVGLTATVEKKDDGWVLKPGCIVTSKEDTIIDEFNLLNEDEIPKLQEAMSEGQITIHKASIHSKLKVKGGVVASANPKYGTFNEEWDIVSQFNLKPQILNRFDAIFIVKDSSNEEEDSAIARQMLKREDNQIKQKYSDESLKRFFLYTRSLPDPRFTSELIEKYIPIKYSQIRKAVKGNYRKLVNPRFVEAIIRLSKSVAKIKFSEVVTKEDVDFVVSLLNKTYLNWGEEVFRKAEELNITMEKVQ